MDEQKNRDLDEQEAENVEDEAIENESQEPSDEFNVDDTETVELSETEEAVADEVESSETEAAEAEPEVSAPKAKKPLGAMIGGICAAAAAVVVVGAIVASALLSPGDVDNGGAQCNHSFSDWVTTVAATCKNEGTATRKCSICDKEETKTLHKTIKHTEVTDAAVAATCTKTGLTEGKHCSVCNKVTVTQVKTPKVAHTYDDKYDEKCNVCGHERDAECAHAQTVTIPGKPASCTATGLTDGQRCTKCNEIVVAQSETPKVAHTYDDKYDEKCNVCGHERDAECAHAQTVTIPGKPASCTATGLTDGQRCTKCNEIVVAQSETPKAAHTYDDKYDEKCNVCGHERDAVCAHTETETIPGKPASCTSTGLTDGEKCKKCGETIISQSIIQMKDHTEVVDAAVAATCTKTGLTEGKHCSVCGTVTLKQSETPIASHTYDDKYDEKCNVCGFIRDAECAHTETETIPGKPASCTSTGLTDGEKCKGCGKILESQSVIDIKPHIEVTDPAVEATCISTGLSEGKHCSVCSKVIVMQTTVPMKPHTEIIDPAVEATCMSTGFTEGKHCAVCNITIQRQSIIPIKEHTIVIDSAIPATCTNSGLTEGSHCSSCGSIFAIQRVVPATEHNYTEATYTTPATCTVCGATTGGVLQKQPINITKPYLPTTQYGQFRVTRCSYSTTWNGDGTYDVKVTFTFTNLTSTNIRGGIWATLSGIEPSDGTAPFVSAYSSATCTVTFEDIPAGDYTIIVD